jgi:hypothetical protein
MPAAFESKANLKLVLRINVKLQSSKPEISTGTIETRLVCG